MKKTTQYISVLLLFLGLYSCQDVVELDLPDTAKRMVISGRVTDQTQTYVLLTTTAGYFDDGRTPRVSDAAVVLIEDGDTVATLAPDSVAGLYSTPYVGVLGKTYEIAVEVFSGNTNFRASRWRSEPEELRRTYAIDSLEVKYLDRTTTPQVFEAGYYALMYFLEPQGPGDNYRLRRWKNDSLFSQEVFVFDDEFFDGRYVGETGFGGIPAFNFFGPFDENEKDSITVEITGITRNHFDFLTILNEQVFQVGGTFDPPPQTILGNIYNADNPKEFGLGYFSASALSIDGIRKE